MEYLSGTGPFDFSQTLLIKKDGTTEVIDKKDGSNPEPSPGRNHQAT